MSGTGREKKGKKYATTNLVRDLEQIINHLPNGNKSSHSTGAVKINQCFVWGFEDVNHYVKAQQYYQEQNR